MSIIFRKLYKKKPDVEYWIPIRDVNITYDFQLSSPRIIKFKRKEKEFLTSTHLRVRMWRQGSFTLKRRKRVIRIYVQCSY